MLRVLLKGWPAEGNPKEFRRLVSDYTSHKGRVTASYMHRLQEGDTVIFAVEAESMIAVLHQFREMGIETVDMYVGPPKDV